MDEPKPEPPPWPAPNPHVDDSRLLAGLRRTPQERLDHAVTGARNMQALMRKLGRQPTPRA